MAEAAEAALDSYLLRPHTHNELAERLKAARHRKQALEDIFEALEAEQYEVATERCLARVEAKSEYWVYAAKTLGIGGLLWVWRHRLPEMRWAVSIEAIAIGVVMWFALRATLGFAPGMPEEQAEPWPKAAKSEPSPAPDGEPREPSARAAHQPADQAGSRPR